MQKIGSSTSTANGAGEFTSGQPGSGIDATMIMAAWLNTIQRELVNVVQGAGLVLNPADDTQVLKAIKALQELGSAWAKITGKPTTIGGFGITDAFTKVETSNAIHQAVADLVASSPESLDTLKELADALGGDPHFATTVLNALAEKAVKATDLPGYGIIPATPTETAAGLSDAKPVTPLGLGAVIAALDPWAMQPLGVPIPVFYHISTTLAPPTNKSYRYISLTANDSYNSGALTSETVSGSSPLVIATSVISLPGSPLAGKVVNMLNTEQRVIRGAMTSGQLLQDALQNITGALTGALVNGAGTGAFTFSRTAAAATFDGANNYGSITFDASRIARTDVETRSKSIGATYFMRIK